VRAAVATAATPAPAAPNPLRRYRGAAMGEEDS
jgi:hypothetical protein